MIVTDRLIYLQMQKCGSHHIQWLLTERFGGRPHGDQHDRLETDPGDRVVLGSVRSPWDWYVSLWAYGCTSRGHVRTWVTSEPEARGWQRSRRILSVAPRRMLRGLDPIPPGLRRDPAMWRDLYGDPGDVARFRRWIRAVLQPPGRGQLPEGYPDSGLARFAGFMTYRFVWLNSRSDRWDRAHREIRTLGALRQFWDESRAIGFCIRTESLERDLAQALRSAGYAIDAAGLATDRRANASPHRDWREYYDRESAALVAQNDAFIIDEFGYEGPSL